MMGGVDESTFRDEDGIEVFYRRWLPADRARALVVVVHGASEHSARYDRFATALTARGYAVYALDQRGHGYTARSTGAGVIGPRGMDGLLDDIGDLTERAVAEVGDRPVVLFGHSMGAVIAQTFAERRDAVLAGLILSGSIGAGDAAPEIIEALQAAVDGGMAAEPIDILGANNAAFEPARTRYDWLSRDPSEVDKYVADPLCGDELPLTYGFVLELVRALADVMTLEAIGGIDASVPVLLITGESDPVSQSGQQVRELERRLRSGGRSVEAHYYADARHELLNETNRDEVTDDVLTWIDRVTG